MSFGWLMNSSLTSCSLNGCPVTALRCLGSQGATATKTTLARESYKLKLVDFRNVLNFDFTYLGLEPRESGAVASVADPNRTLSAEENDGEGK
jgi:hypothetical protein